MKRMITYLCLVMAVMLASTAFAQADKSKRASPPAKVSQKLKSGATISIDYSQPSLKGRTVGKDVEPMKNQVWRMGANEATVFETDKDVKIEGQTLPAGKYSLFGVWTDNGFNLIFNKAWKVWGTEYEENKTSDALSVTVQPRTVDAAKDKLTYTIDPSGKVTLWWGTMAVDFKVK